MKYKYVLILAGCVVVMSLILVALYGSSTLSKGIYRASFDRNFMSNPTIPMTASLDLEYNSFYFAGTTKGHLYLGNWTAPFHLLITNTQLADTQHVRLGINNLANVKNYGGFRLKVDSPYFFLMHGGMPGIFRGQLDHWRANRITPEPSDNYFVEAVPIGSLSVGLRSYSLKSKGYELAKETCSMRHFEFKYGLLEKQVDGLFCVDGILHYSKDLNRLIYLYFYRNQYVVMDTSLNLINRYHTIDTFSRARIRVANIESQQFSTLAAPPLQVNGNSCVSGDYLFVQSGLLAKNENEENFRNSSVIDVYDLRNGIYSHSFYIPYYMKKRPSSFIVVNSNQLAAIFDHYLVMYSLNSLGNTNF